MKRHRETEIKLPARDRTQLGRLAQLGFKVLRARHFESNYLFDFPDLRLRRCRCLLRLRFADGEDRLTFKGPPLGSCRYKSRREIEVRVEDGVLLIEVLKSLGLKQTFIYEKYRTIYAEGGKADFHGLRQVTFDETPIGNYLELEGPEGWIDEIATRLGYSRRDYIASSYLALYVQKRREEGKKPGNMVFKRGKAQPFRDGGTNRRSGTV
jgi:adenylate cyclase class 2